MKRSPQKLKTQPGQHPAWQCEISGKLRTIPVTSDTELKFLATANAEQQQAILEELYHRQQHAATSSTTSNIASNTMPQATPKAADRNILPKPILPSQPTEATPTITSGEPKHSSTPLTATSRHSEVISPVSIDMDLEDIKDRTAKFEEDFIKAREENPIQKDLNEAMAGNLTQKDEEINPASKKDDLAESKSDDNKETQVKVPACQDRIHEFEQRTKQYLSVPGKRFAQAYRTCKYHLERNAHVKISHELVQRLLHVLVQCFHEVQEARDYCLEALSEEDILNNPKYEEYMDLKLDQLNECSGLQDRYLERWYSQDSQLLHAPPQVQENEHQIDHSVSTKSKGLQGACDVATIPPEDIVHQTSHAQVYQPPSKLPIMSRPPPVIVDKPMGPLHHLMPPKGQHQQQMGPPLANPQSTGAFQVYKDPSPIPTPTGPSVIYEPTHLKFRLKDELEVIEPFDGSKPREYLRFRVQWQNLNDKMIQTNMSELDKYNALRKVLTGKAKRLIDTKYPDNGTYQRSRDKLETTYYKPKLHVTEVIHSLAKPDPMTDTYESLFNGYNRLKDSWDDLEHLNLSKGQLKGLLLITANEKNLSQGTWTLWNHIQNDPRYAENSMECLNVDAFLGAIQIAMNNAQRRQNVIGRHTTTDQKPKPKSTLYGTYSTTVKPPTKQVIRQAGSGCVFCSRTTHHRYQLYCPALKTLKPEQIWDIMKANGITCQMCLCLGHKTQECEPTRRGTLKKCSIKDNGKDMCGKFHCRFLHRAPKKEQSTEAKESTPANKQ